MLDGSEQSGDGSGVAGEGDEDALVVGEDVIQEILQPSFLVRVTFALVGLPQEIALGETRLEGVAGECRLDGRFVAAAIACVDSDCLAEVLGRDLDWCERGKWGDFRETSHGDWGGAEGGGDFLQEANLFHLWDEGFVFWKIQARECDLRGFQTACERAGIVGFWNWDALIGDFFGPKVVGDLGLLNPFFGDAGVSPSDGAVSVLLRPVALVSSFVSLTSE